MQEILAGANVEFGRTMDGRDWCIKALHPADQLLEVHGIPDEDGIATTMLQYQATMTIGASEGATNTWDLIYQMTPNPLQFGYAAIYDSVSTHSVNPVVVGFHNPQLWDEEAASADQGGKSVAVLCRDFEAWRLAYMSVTAVHEGPTLADQGSVVACQKPVRFTNVPAVGLDPNGSAYGYNEYIATTNVSLWHASDVPNYSATAIMPNAYIGRARDGVYMPLKLDPTAYDWHGEHDMTGHGALFIQYDPQSSESTLRLGTAIQSDLNNDTYALGLAPYPEFLATHRHYVTTTKTGQDVQGQCRLVPRKGLSGLRYNVVSEPAPPGTTTTYEQHNCPIPAPMNGQWGDICFKGLSVSARIVFTVRLGLEVQIRPGSQMAPFLRPSPEYDPVALATYALISRRMKDAYPADYNDADKIWRVISTALKAVGPALTLIPEVGPFLAMGTEGVAFAGDAIANIVAASREPKEGNVSSSADNRDAIEHVRALSVAAPNVRIEGGVAPTAPRTIVIRRSDLRPSGQPAGLVGRSKPRKRRTRVVSKTRAAVRQLR